MRYSKNNYQLISLSVSLVPAIIKNFEKCLSAIDSVKKHQLVYPCFESYFMLLLRR